MVVLITNWGNWNLISKCSVKIDKQLKKALVTDRQSIPLYLMRFRIFSLLDTGVYDYKRYNSWSMYSHAGKCQESNKEASLIGKFQQGHGQCGEYSCIQKLDC